MIQQEEKIIYKDLSFQINKVLFRVHNNLGRYCNEKQICDALAQELSRESIQFEREKVLPPSFEGELSGRNRVDFFIGDKIILEIKCKRYLVNEDYYQVKRYLQVLNLRLGILVNFRDERLKPRRVLN